jgi:hypothetical protein
LVKIASWPIVINFAVVRDKYLSGGFLAEIEIMA